MRLRLTMILVSMVFRSLLLRCCNNVLWTSDPNNRAALLQSLGDRNRAVALGAMNAFLRVVRPAVRATDTRAPIVRSPTHHVRDHGRATRSVVAGRGHALELAPSDGVSCSVCSVTD